MLLWDMSFPPYQINLVPFIFPGYYSNKRYTTRICCKKTCWYILL